MGRGEAREDLLVQRKRAQDDATFTHGDEEIGHRDLPVLGSSRSPEVRDLVPAQDRPREDIADPAFREVNDLGVHGRRLARLFDLQVAANATLKLTIQVTKTAEE